MVTVSSEHMQIGEVAARTELSLRTIRHYEETGLVTPSARSRGGFRLYTEADVARLMVVRRMKPSASAWTRCGTCWKRSTASTTTGDGGRRARRTPGAGTRLRTVRDRTGRQTAGPAGAGGGVRPDPAHPPGPERAAGGVTAVAARPGARTTGSMLTGAAHPPAHTTGSMTTTATRRRGALRARSGAQSTPTHSHTTAEITLRPFIGRGMISSRSDGSADARSTTSEEAPAWMPCCWP